MPVAGKKKKKKKPLTDEAYRLRFDQLRVDRNISINRAKGLEQQIAKTPPGKARMALQARLLRTQAEISRADLRMADLNYSRVPLLAKILPTVIGQAQVGVHYYTRLRENRRIRRLIAQAERIEAGLK